MIKRNLLITMVLLGALTIAGCGYTTRSSLSSDLQTIYIPEFKNSISYTSDNANRTLYIPLIEVDIHKAIVDRFLFDGNLDVENDENANLILRGELVNYDRRALRYTDDDEVEEYRIYLYVNLVLINTQSDQVVWSESNFVGEATYFISGSLAKSEDEAIDEAILDLARRVVERTVEDW